MGLFEDINAIVSNVKGVFEFERQGSNLSNPTRSHTQPIRMVANYNQSGSTTNSKSTSNKTTVVKKLVRKDKETKKSQPERKEKNANSSNKVATPKVNKNTVSSEINVLQTDSHIKLPDISTIRDGVVWSEILGPPRCKRRYERYKNR